MAGIGMMRLNIHLSNSCFYLFVRDFDLLMIFELEYKNNTKKKNKTVG